MHTCTCIHTHTEYTGIHTHCNDFERAEAADTYDVHTYMIYIHPYIYIFTCSHMHTYTCTHTRTKDDFERAKAVDAFDAHC